MDNLDCARPKKFIQNTREEEIRVLGISISFFMFFFWSFVVVVDFSVGDGGLENW